MTQTNNNPNPNTSASQKRRILEYLKQGKTLTNREAQRLFECDRAPARIKELRDGGYPIKTEMITVNSGKRIGRYSMELKEAAQ